MVCVADFKPLLALSAPFLSLSAGGALSSDVVVKCWPFYIVSQTVLYAIRFRSKSYLVASMLLSRVALAVAAVGVAVYYLFSNYWYFLPGFLSYFTLVVYPHRPSNWEAQLQAGVPPTRRIEGKAGEQPNVIFIVADDLGYNDISYYGGGLPGVETKHIDSIGREGVGFTNGYAGHATCAPSRASIMTGR